MSLKIPFNIPFLSGQEESQLKMVLQKKKFCGDGTFTKASHEWLTAHLGQRKSLLTTSCTHALEMSALLCDIKPGDEVIMPSFTFVSTSNAFVLRGARIRFVDVRPDTMNIDEKLIEAAINKHTKAIVVVHYAGISCEMDFILALAEKYKLKVIEDAAQGLGASYKNRPLGTLSDYATFSFHETKNIHCGEGGALTVKTPGDALRAEVIREKGTDRSQFLRGQIDKYTWQDLGSSYLPSELNAAFLMAQLPHVQEVSQKRRQLWTRYSEVFSDLEKSNKIECPKIPSHCISNGHIFWLKCRDLAERTRLTEWLLSQGIQAAFHYIPLHSSPAGQRFGQMQGEDRFTTTEGDRLLRLPMYFDLKMSDIELISERVSEFYRKS